MLAVARAFLYYHQTPLDQPHHEGIQQGAVLALDLPGIDQITLGKHGAAAIGRDQRAQQAAHRLAFLRGNPCTWRSR